MAKLETSTIEKYQSILAKDPGSQVFAPLADAYIEMGLLVEAEKLAREGVKRHPQFAAGHLVYGKVLKAAEKYDEAIIALKMAIQQAPTNILAHQLLGEIYFEEKEAKEALKCFKMVLFLNPQAQRARKIVEKLESITADEFSDEAFQMKPLQSLRPDVQNSRGDSTLVGTLQFNSQEETRIGGATKVGAAAGDALLSKATNESQKIDRALQRMLSLIDALIVRNEIGKAQFMIQDCFKEFGDHPELLMRSRTLLLKANPQLGDEAAAEPVTSIKPIQSREKLAQQRKLEVLHLLLRKIEDARI